MQDPNRQVERARGKPRALGFARAPAGGARTGGGGRLVFLALIGILGVAVLLALGSWQIRRLAWKEAVLAEIETRIAAPPVALPADPDPLRDRYLPVRVRGTFGAAERPVLVSLRDAGAGYRIIAPFTTEDGRRILIDRGFVPAADKDRARRTGPAEITGNLHWPDEVDGFTPEPDRGARIWFARDLPSLAADLGTEPVLVVARTPGDPAIRPLPVSTEGIPNDHLQYAVTWFGLALVWAGMTGYFLWQGRARRPQPHPERQTEPQSEPQSEPRKER